MPENTENAEIYLFNTSRNQSLEVDHSIYISYILYLYCVQFSCALIAHYSSDYYFSEWILINKFS